MSDLTEEQRILIEANREKAKRLRLEKYLDDSEQVVEEPVLEGRQIVAETLGGGFIPKSDDDEQQPLVHTQAEILFPLELNDTCIVCGSVELDDFLRKNYKVNVCESCRETHQERFKLVTKTAAKDEFLLTDEELRDESRMPHILKPNPLRPTWSNMQLFLKEQVRAFAIEKWGSLEAIEEEAQKRVDVNQALKEKKFSVNLGELRRKTKLATKGGGVPKLHNHKHEFVERRTGDGQIESKCSSCGFTIVSEEL